MQWRLQLEKTREARTKEQLDRLNELHLLQIKDQINKERERSIEQEKKALQDYHREQLIEEERRRIKEEKEKRKRENMERAQLGVIEIKQRKQEIDQMMSVKHKQLKDKVLNKVALIQEKYYTVEEERMAKAAELKKENEFKIKMAQEKEEFNRK